MKCEEHVDKGKTRIKGWHDFAPCKNTAKYKVHTQVAMFSFYVESIIID